MYSVIKFKYRINQFEYNKKESKGLQITEKEDEKVTKDEMWKAVSENDKSYDGLFFYAVKSTGIYCRPSCKSKLPKRDNVSFFKTAVEACEAGFRPCKRCRSDLMDYQPMKEIAQKTKKLLDKMFHERSELNEELRKVGVTQHRMVEIFKEQYGMTLNEYVNGLRLKEAKRLLTETDDEVIDIAYSVGFSSLSAFYRFFKKETNQAPSKFRKEVRKIISI